MQSLLLEFYCMRHTLNEMFELFCPINVPPYLNSKPDKNLAIKMKNSGWNRITNSNNSILWIEDIIYIYFDVKRVL